MIIFVVDCAVINICFHHQQLLNGKTLNPVNVQQYFKAGTHKCLIHKHFTIFSSKNMKPNNSNINSQVSIKITFVTKGCWGGERFFFFTGSDKVGGGGKVRHFTKCQPVLCSIKPLISFLKLGEKGRHADACKTAPNCITTLTADELLCV